MPHALYAPLSIRMSFAPDVHVGKAGDYDPATGKVEGAEDPCYGAAPGLAHSICMWYRAHPEKRQGGDHPLNDPAIHLYFDRAEVDKARAQQAAYAANPALYAVGHYAKMMAIPVGVGGIVGLKWGVLAGLLTFGGLGALQALGTALMVLRHSKNTQ